MGVDQNFLSACSGSCRQWLILVVCLFFMLQANAGGKRSSGDYTIFLKDDKKGLRDHKNNVVIPADYEDLGWSSGGFAPVEGVLGYKENGLWGLINLKNQRIISPHYSQLLPFKQQHFIVAQYDHEKKEDVYGIINLKGNAVLSSGYHFLQSFSSFLIACTSQDGQWKYGLLDESYHTVIPYIYDAIQPLSPQYALIRTQGKVGLINHLGQIVVNPKYREIKMQGNKLMGRLFDTFELKSSKNQLLGSYQVNNMKIGDLDLYIAEGPISSSLVNITGTMVMSFENSHIGDFQEGRAVIRQGQKFGVVDRTGKLLLPIAYDSIWMKEGYLGVLEGKEKWMLLNGDLNKITQKDYQLISTGSEDLFPVKRHGSWGYVNANGIEVIPPQYDEVKPFAGGVAQASYDGSWGLIDSDGNWLIKPRYQSLRKLSVDTYLFRSQNRQGLLAKNGNVIYETHNRLLGTTTGIIEQDSSQNLGLISFRGDRLLSTRYHRLHMLEASPSYYFYQDSLQQGLYNIEDRTFINDPSIQEIRTLEEGFIGVRINNQYGFIDLNGKLRVANRYEDVGVFSETMSPIQIKGKWGYIDRLERLKIQPVYDSAGPFNNGLAIVSQNQKFGLVTVKGNLQLPLAYDKLERLPGGRFVCYRGKSQGLIDVSGKLLLHPKFEQVNDLGNGFVIVSRQLKYSLVSDQGVSVIPMIYDGIRYDAVNDLYILHKKPSWESIKL